MRRKPFAWIALLTSLAVIGVGAGSASATGSPARSIVAANTLEAQILVELNAVRRKHGLVPLKLASSLGAAADSHSRGMGRYGYFTHESRDGGEFWKRVKHFYGSTGYDTWSVGENLLWASPTVDAAEALRLWMKSPTHRKNLLTPRWREIGLSAVTAESAPGVFGGRDVIIVTTDFGIRS